jgi:hypothetical protein
MVFASKTRSSASAFQSIIRPGSDFRKSAIDVENESEAISIMDKKKKNIEKYKKRGIPTTPLMLWFVNSMTYFKD